jgi:hypothetical protein
MSAAKNTREEIAQGIAIVADIQRQVVTLFDSLEREMQARACSQEFRAIMWEAVTMEAQKRWREASK